MLNTINYNPIDNDSDTGFRRPPKDAAALADYFFTLSFLEDDGDFIKSEYQALLDNDFFKSRTL